MTKEQADAKMAILVGAGALSTAPDTYYEFINDVPYLAFEYLLVNGGVGTISIPIQHTTTNLQDLANNLPIPAEQRLASIAIMLSPSLV